jgi:hypothetical protein
VPRVGPNLGQMWSTLGRHLICPRRSLYMRNIIYGSCN